MNDGATRRWGRAAIVFAVVVAPVMMMPDPLPEITLRSATDVPPMMVPVEPLEMLMPAFVFPRTVLPFSCKPMVFPMTTLLAPPAISIPLWSLPEIRFASMVLLSAVAVIWMPCTVLP